MVVVVAVTFAILIATEGHRLVTSQGRRHQDVDVALTTSVDRHREISTPMFRPPPAGIINDQGRDRLLADAAGAVRFLAVLLYHQIEPYRDANTARVETTDAADTSLHNDDDAHHHRVLVVETEVFPAVHHHLRRKGASVAETARSPTLLTVDGAVAAAALLRRLAVGAPLRPLL